MELPTTSSRPRRHRRLLLYGLLVGLAASAAGVGLAGHRARQAEAAIDRLRRVGVIITERWHFPDWWSKLPPFARDYAPTGTFGHKTCEAVCYGKAATADNLRTAAQLPGLYSLRIYDAPAM